MNMITRHNYEEFFILYMDKELSSDERRMVETFVQQHPDLKEELDLLLQYKLVPDTAITFNGKEELIKVNGETPVTLTNYEEWFLLYLDNELSADQKKTVEQFLSANPAIQKEFSVLQRTRLQPEKIVFDSKASLYRKEVKVRPLINYKWRVAAAILVLLLGGMTYILVSNKPSAGKGIDIATVPVKEQKTTGKDNVSPVQTGNKEAVAVLEEKETPAKNPLIKEEVKPFNINTVTARPKDIRSKNIELREIKNETAVVNNDKPSNNLPQPLNNPAINKADAKPIAKNDIPKEIINPKNISSGAVVTNKPTPPLNIVQASYPADNNEDLDQSSGKKSKLRGFFRKVTRTFEKRTNIDATPDDNKLLVAGLSIKLK
ncbi:MAG: hypothetical protein ABIT05_01900 [Chitinophagaceae bacterium]